MDRIEINPETDALLVIDMQPDFMEGGALAVLGGRALVDIVNQILTRFAKRRATKDWHGRGHKSFAANHVDQATGQAAPEYSMTTMPYGEQRLWPIHCVQGTPGAELHPELRADLIDGVVLKGWRDEVDSYSAFLENDGVTTTEMADVLRADGVKRIFVCGLTRPYCVDFTALDGTNLGFETFVVEDAVGELGPRDELDASRAKLEAAGVRFVTSDMLVLALDAAPAL